VRLRGNFAVCLVLALAMPVLPALAQAPEPEDRSAEERTELDDVTLSFRFRSGEEFEVDQLLQQWGVALGQIVIADSQIRGQKIKLLTQSATMTWKVFKKILMMNGVVVVEEKVGADQLLIKAYMQRNLQTNESPPFSFEGVGRRLPRRSEIVTAAIQVKNGAGREIFATVRGLLTRDRNRVGEILHVPGPEVILVTDFAPNVEYYKNIIQALDIQAPGQKIRIRKLEYAIPSELSQVLSQLFTTDDSLGRPIGFQVAVGAQVEQPLFVAHDPTLKLVIRAYDYQFDEIERLITELDVKVKEETGKFHVYKCQSANAEVLAEKLSELFANRIQGRAGQQTAGAAPAGRRGGAGGLRRPAAPTTTAGAAGTAGPRDVETRIIADRRTNSLLIQAEEEDYSAIQGLLRRLDKKRRRVFIEAMVWEISANDDLTIATELAALARPHQGSLRPLSATSFGLSDVTITQNGVGRDVASRLQQGITAILTKDTFDRVPIIINVLETQSQSKNITTPFATTNDNEQAVFRVVDRQPFNTTTINNVASQQNVQFVDATSALSIEPQVNSNDNLTLNIELVISSFGTRPSPDLPPSTTSRQYQGLVTVPNGKYIVFGGLDSESESIVESKVPFLGDIPYLGHLFKSWRRSESQTKVYVFIRPVIFYDENFRDDIRASDYLRKKAHLESEREEWRAPIIPDRNAPSGSIQDKVFEYFGTGSATPFDG